MSYQEIMAFGEMKPIYSPRSSMSHYIKEVEQRKTNLAINIDKETLLLFKDEFEDNENKMSMV